VAPEVKLEELFEPSSPLARRLRGSADPIGEARRLARELAEEEKIATLNAHPRIGERPERMSARSTAEQGSEEVPDLGRLNEDYERRFGFRFVVFVNRRSRAEIAEVLKERMTRTRSEEMEEGLRAIVDIAEYRLRRATT
jgi:2-oxo-4-hydroxy-4-carboxy--5-ureidoimidazoline (OHCU) decarboxylase